MFDPPYRRINCVACSFNCVESTVHLRVDDILFRFRCLRFLTAVHRCLSTSHYKQTQNIDVQQIEQITTVNSSDSDTAVRMYFDFKLPCEIMPTRTDKCLYRQMFVKVVIIS